MDALICRTTGYEFARYLVAGGSAFLVDLALLTALVEGAGVSYLVAAPFGYAAGFATAYFLSVRWVFQYRKYADIHPEMFIFLLIGLLGIAINQMVMYLSVSGLGYSYLFGKVLATGVAFLFNFVLRKLLLFSGA